eukprot:1438461-Rhodomonas_salina.2
MTGLGLHPASNQNDRKQSLCRGMCIRIHPVMVFVHTCIRRRRARAFRWSSWCVHLAPEDMPAGQQGDHPTMDP